MSKEVEKSKINITKEFIKKQIIDCIAIFIVLSIVFYVVYFQDFGMLEFGVTLGVLYLITFLVFEYNKNDIKRLIDNVISSSTDVTITEIETIQNKNNSQKQNNVISNSKIKDAINIIENLQKYSQNMKELTDLTQEKTNQSLNFTNSEYGAIKTNIEKMFSIRHKIQTIAELILELSDFVQSISSTVGLVEDIAEQTNLLALNAAVEAARAGEHGKGFAVVASEIRKLADESKQATTKIISLINDIQQTANSTVLATEEGTKEIESGLEHAHIISENIEQLINVMNEISTNMKEIIISSKQIQTDSITTDNYMKEISQIVEESQKITDENDTIFEKIESASNNLKQSIV